MIRTVMLIILAWVAVSIVGVIIWHWYVRRFGGPR